MSNSNTAKFFSAMATLATRYAAVPSRIDTSDHWYATPAEPVTVVPSPPSAPPPVPDPEPATPTAPTGAPSGSSGGCFVLPFSVHPSHDCIYHPNACPDSGWPRGGGRNRTNTSIHRNPLRGGEPPKHRTNLLSSSGRQCPIARNTAHSLRPHGGVRRRTPLRWGTTMPSRKMFSPPPGSLLTRPLILRIHVPLLQ